MKTTIQIDFTFEQVLSLVRQLPKQQKIQLSRELEKEVIDSKLSKLLNTFKSDELDLEVIEEEVENVRREMYEKQKH
ncbi:type II toxin-antitoxin system VapB15 family antitoxin [Runella zeae]|uniref:type II toxin-antitoxin system VapB15 family antitoxin n=1 Tax=Runella zeae TaxID=94255 RepID=UPI00049206B8|nr:hypothetical protein [Runella zeae]